MTKEKQLNEFLPLLLGTARAVQVIRGVATAAFRNRGILSTAKKTLDIADKVSDAVDTVNSVLDTFRNKSSDSNSSDSYLPSSDSYSKDSNSYTPISTDRIDLSKDVPNPAKNTSQQHFDKIPTAHIETPKSTQKYKYKIPQQLSVVQNNNVSNKKYIESPKTSVKKIKSILKASKKTKKLNRRIL